MNDFGDVGPQPQKSLMEALLLATLLRNTRGKVFVNSLPNKKDDGDEKRITSRSAWKIDEFVRKHDRPGWATYFCTTTLKADWRCKANACEAAFAFADVDLKDLDLDLDEVLKRLDRLALYPSLVISSGHGLHLYFYLDTPTEDMGRIEAVNAKIGDIVCGDPRARHSVTLLRCPGSHNSKGGDWLEVAGLGGSGQRFSLEELEGWRQDPVLTPKGNAANGENPYAAHARKHGFKTPIDVEARLEAMKFNGVSDSAVHLTQLSVTASLMRAGWDEDAVVERVLDRTKEVATEAGVAETWNWRKEEAAIRKMCTDFVRMKVREAEKESVVVDLAEAKAKKKTRAKVEAEAERTTDDEAALGEPMIGPRGGVNFARYRRTDAGNALAFVDLFGGDLKFVESWKAWLVWKDGRWREASDLQMLPLARSATEEMLKWAVTRNSGDGRDALIKHAIATQKSERLRAMFNLAKGEQRVRTEPKALDTDRWLIGCPNGTLDLRTGNLREARREDLITKLIGAPHDREAKCPNWEATVLWMTKGDQAVADFLQAFAGYALTGEVREELLLALYGTGSNAKSTLVMMLLALMGEYGWKASSDLLVHSQGKEGAPTPDVAELVGKRLVVVSETENECELSEAQVKSITSNEVIPARRLHCQPFVFSPTHKTILSTNHRPRVRGTDHGIWRRLATVSCEAKRNEKDEITDYRERHLMPELPGILNWALAGLARYREEGKLKLPQAMIEARAKHRSDEDLIGQWLAEQTIAHPGDAKATELQADLHHDYVDWLGKANRPLGKIRFGLALEERGFVRTYLLDKRAGIEGLRLRWRVEAEAEATKRAAARAAKAKPE